MSSLLTNSEVLAVDQHSTGNHPVVSTDATVVWVAQQSDAAMAYYVAVFNTSTASETLHYSWKDLGVPAGSYKVRDLWEHKDLGIAGAVDVALPAHGSVLYGLWPAETR